MSENLFLGDTTYPHLPDAENQSVLVIDTAGNPVLKICGDVKAPANYSFECVNNFVHCEDPQYEELQYLALGMSNRIEQLEAELAEARKDQARYKWLRNNTLVDGEINDELYVAVDSEKWSGRWALVGDELDQAIDAAIKEQQ